MNTQCREISLKEMIINIILALSYLYFVCHNFAFLSIEFRLSVALVAVFNLFLCVNALFRRPPNQVSFTLFDIFITLMGSYSVTFMVGVNTSEEYLILKIIGICGLLISLSGVLYLNKSFGLLPADRLIS